jgi:enamine deaminase RidA (YjgF/YER057c/UK114 family)
VNIYAEKRIRFAMMSSDSSVDAPIVPRTTFVSVLIRDRISGAALKLEKRLSLRRHPGRYGPTARLDGHGLGIGRGLLAGDTVRVAGTIATDDDGEVVAPGDPSEQTRHALSIVADALEDLGASVDDVVQTRMYVTDIDDMDAVGRAHGEVFGDVRPAATMVKVAGLAAADAVVEIEVEAVVE